MVDFPIEPSTASPQGVLETLQRDTAQALRDSAIALPAILHDYTHGIPLERLMALPSRTSYAGGDIDVHSAWKAAITSPEVAGRKILVPDRMKLKLVADEPTIVPAEGLTIECHGGQHVWWHVENSEQPIDEFGNSLPNNHNGYYDLLNLLGAGDLSMSGFAIEGSGRTGLRDIQGTRRFINGGGKLRADGTHGPSGRVVLDRMEFRFPRAIPLFFESCLSVETRRTIISHTHRDGVQLRGIYEYWIFRDVLFWRTRDDAINANGGRSNPNADYGPYTQPVGLLENCRFIESGGARVSGHLGFRARGNFHWLGTNHAYAVDRGMDTNTPQAMLSCDIEDNTILDMVRLPDPYDHGTSFAVLLVDGPAPRAAAGEAVSPGQIDPATGTWLPTQGREATTPRATDAMMALRGLRFRRNKVRRTIKTGVPYSSYGMGPAWESFEAVQDGHPDGFTDYTIPAANSRPDGVVITGSVEDMVIEDNDFDGLRHGILIDLPNGVPAIVKGRFEGNAWSDLSGNFISSTLFTRGRRFGLRFVRERINLDPHFTHPNRLPDGAWNTDTTAGAIFNPNGYVDAMTGFSIEDSEIRNAARIATGSAHLTGGNLRLRNVTLYGDPVAVGDHADNRGIRVWPTEGSEVVYRIVESNPTSPDLGQPKASRLPVSITTAGAGPQSGTVILPAGRESMSVLFPVSFPTNTKVAVSLNVASGGGVTVTADGATPWGFTIRCASPPSTDTLIDWRAAPAVAAVARAWAPEDSVSLVGLYTALTGLRQDAASGITYLDERTGRLAPMASLDGTPITRPAMASLADGMPAISVTGNKPLVTPQALSLLNYTVWCVARPTGMASNTQSGLWALGASANGAATGVRTASTTQVLLGLTSTAPYSTIVNSAAPMDWLNQWITEEVAYTATGVTHRINGQVYAQATWGTPLASALAFAGAVLGQGITRGPGIASDLAHFSIWDSPTAADRDAQIAYLKATWGARVTGW